MDPSGKKRDGTAEYAEYAEKAMLLRIQRIPRLKNSCLFVKSVSLGLSEESRCWTAEFRETDVEVMRRTI
jgi:hypothetical protein